jgi:hypothetical protein
MAVKYILKERGFRINHGCETITLVDFYILKEGIFIVEYLL